MDFNPDLDYRANISTYKRSKKRLQEIDTTGWSVQDKSHVASMIRDCEYVIEWLETGRRPGNKRGVERLAAYQREIPTDVIERYMKPPEPLNVGMHTEQEWAHAEYILSMLTDRERECYEMHVGGQYSEREIAHMLGITGPAVHQNIKRAQNKIKSYKRHPMPTLLEIVV